jgi:hypothetical protein
MNAQENVAHIVAVVAALALSGIALADHNPNHGTGKDKPKDPPGKPVSKSSIEVVSLCEPAYLNQADAPGNYLKVTSAITNQSEEIVEIDTIMVDGFQLVPVTTEPDAKGKGKKRWTAVGNTQYPGTPAPPFTIDVDPEGVDPISYSVYIDLCQAPTLSADAVALNVTSQIMVDGRNFTNNCDDPNPDDEIDQSKIDLEQLVPPLSCSGP